MSYKTIEEKTKEPYASNSKSQNLDDFGRTLAERCSSKNVEENMESEPSIEDILAFAEYFKKNIKPKLDENQRIRDRSLALARIPRSYPLD